MGVESWLKVVRGAVWCGGGSWGALVSGGWRTSQAAAHRAGVDGDGGACRRLLSLGAEGDKVGHCAGTVQSV